MLRAIESDLMSDDVELRRQAVLAMRIRPEESVMHDYVRLLMRALQDASWRVRKAAVEVLMRHYPLESYLNVLIKLLYVDDNAGARNAAIETLTKLGKQVTDRLISAFDTTNEDVRKFIIDIIGKVKDKKALPLLIRALKDEDENVRASTVEYLGVMQVPSVVESLIEIIEGEDMWTAYPAVEALGRIGDTRALPTLIKALDNPMLREPSLRALGRLAQPETLERIVPYLNVKSKAIQHAALNALEMFYHQGVSEEILTAMLKKQFGEGATDLLIGHTRSSRADLRLSAILFLGLLKDEKALGPLLDLCEVEEFQDDIKRALLFIGSETPESLIPLFQTSNTTQLRFICQVASDVASPQYNDIFIGLLDNEDGHIRGLAALGLSNIGDTGAIGHIMKLLADPYPDVQELIIRALSRLKDGLDLGEIIQMLRSDDPVIRRNVVMLLGQFDAGEVITSIDVSLKDDDVLVRKAAVKVLSKFPPEQSVKYIMTALTDEDPDVRVLALQVLGRAEGMPVAEHVLLMLNDQDDMVRVAAIKALGMIGDDTAMPELVRQLNDDNGFVVTTAIESISKVGGDASRFALLDMLESSDLEYRRTAIRALAGYEGIEEIIIPFLHDNDWATRVAAVETLSGSQNDLVRTEMETLFDDEEDSIVIRALEIYLNA